MALDEHSIREQFPALQADQVFLDNAGGSQVLGAVIDSIKKYLSFNNVQLGATYAIGKKSTAKFDAAYEAGARYINAGTDEIVYGASTTQLMRNLSYALKFKPGDEIVVSQIDHEANIAPWVDLAERQDLVLKWWKPTDSDVYELRATELQRLISDKTRLVTCTHSSNILGTINDIKAIANVAHSVGALCCVDAVAYAPHRPIDVKDLGVDFYSFSWYKVYGPHVSMLYGSWEAQTQLKSLGHFFNPSATLEDKLGLAAGSYELIQSVPLVVKYLMDLNPSMWSAIIAHEEALQSKLLEYLTSQPDITVYGVPKGDASRRVATVSFTVKNWDSQTLVETVEANSPYGFRWGAFYSDRLVRQVMGLGQKGVVRVSMVHYNKSKSRYFH